MYGRSVQNMGKQKPFEALLLSEADYRKMAYELAVRLPEKQEKLLPYRKSYHKSRSAKRVSIHRPGCESRRNGPGFLIPFTTESGE